MISILDLIDEEFGSKLARRKDYTHNCSGCGKQFSSQSSSSKWCSAACKNKSVRDKKGGGGGGGDAGGGGGGGRGRPWELKR